jgi:HTH-type transcriptional regulator/antitoxin HigA
MGIYPIRNEADHRRALARIETLMDAESLTAEQGDELDALVTLVSAYEDKHFPIRDATPIQVIEFMMDQHGLTRKDLEPMIGSRARVSEVLSGKRKLTLAMIRALSSAWAISADLLLGGSDKQRRTKRGRASSAKESLRQARARKASRSQGQRGVAA